jgi:hypothetical protein
MLPTSHLVIQNFENAFGIEETCMNNIRIYELNIYDYINWRCKLKVCLNVTLSV